MTSFQDFHHSKFHQSKDTFLSSAAQIFFSDENVSAQKCHLLTQNFNQSLEWEKESVSIHSIQGCVKDNETLARNIFSPIHIDEESCKYTRLAFDDILNKGLSVIRFDYALHEGVIVIGQKKLDNDLPKNPDRKYVGYASASALKFRECSLPESNITEQILAIYDTALEECIYHADICSIKALTKNQKQLLRNFLHKIFEHTFVPT